MPKKQKGPVGPGLDPFKIGISICRFICSILIIYSGVIMIQSSGDRVYTKYLHSLRKMQDPKGKPTDQAVAGMSFDELFKIMIKLIGGVQALAGLLLLVG